jgi:hypothetical protein
MNDAVMASFIVWLKPVSLFMVLFLPKGQNKTMRGLSLRTLSPAAAWYFIVCVSFFRPVGRKNDTQRIEQDQRAKDLINNG